jgi:hypothetical protein
MTMMSMRPSRLTPMYMSLPSTLVAAPRLVARDGSWILGSSTAPPETANLGLAQDSTFSLSSSVPGRRT